jgi:hypothetical protein
LAVLAGPAVPPTAEPAAPAARVNYIWLAASSEMRRNVVDGTSW